MSELGLNDHHQSTIVNYLRFARYQRGQRMKAVDLNFKEMKSSRLTEDTYTIDEVDEMLDDLLDVVHGDVESELINTAHTNVLLLRQLFQQAEQWHLKLQADISELENRELLERIKAFEDRQLSGAKGDGPKLVPMNEGGGTALLKMEIDRLNEENSRLRSKLGMAQDQASGAQQDRHALEAEMLKTKKMLDAAKSGRVHRDEDEINELRSRMAQLQSNLSQSEASRGEVTRTMEGQLSTTKHELLKVREMLEMAEKELEKKVSQTAPFKNLKQMLQKKNEQMKDLRRRLSKYESLDD